MPLTFPSHAAAVLPLLYIAGTRRLPASALVVGSTAPDLIYLIGTKGADAHRPLGLLWFCLPAGIVAFLYLEALLLRLDGGAHSPGGAGAQRWAADIAWLSFCARVTYTLLHKQLK